jgi:hypothetical protein
MVTPSAKPPTAVRDRRRAQEHSGDEHESFLRSVALVDWLVLLLVVLYLVVSREPPPSLALTTGAIVGFAGFLLAFRSKRFPLRSPVRRIALDVFVTIVFLTVVVMQAGGAESPLVNLYLLPLVLCAVTLRARVTLLAFLLVGGAVLLLHLMTPGDRSRSAGDRWRTSWGSWGLSGWSPTSRTGWPDRSCTPASASRTSRSAIRSRVSSTSAAWTS